MTLMPLVPLPYKLAGAAVAVVVAVGAVTMQVHRYGSGRYTAGQAEVQGRWTAADLVASQVAITTAAEYRQREAEQAARTTTAEDKYAALQPIHARLLVAQRSLLAERGELRGAIEAYAAGSGRAAPDTAAAASERAAALGLLLSEALLADAESSTAADSSADAVRALLEAWPR